MGIFNKTEAALHDLLKAQGPDMIKARIETDPEYAQTVFSEHGLFIHPVTGELTIDSKFQRIADEAQAEEDAEEVISTFKAGAAKTGQAITVAADATTHAVLDVVPDKLGNAKDKVKEAGSKFAERRRQAKAERIARAKEREAIRQAAKAEAEAKAQAEADIAAETDS